MSYSWTQFFIAIFIMVVLYYVVVYVLFFLRKAPAHNSAIGKENNNNAAAKNSKKNNQQTNMHLAAAATILIDTKVINDDYFKTENDFVINESINQNYVDENGVLQDHTTSIINDAHAQDAIIHEVDKINTDKINLSQTNDHISIAQHDDKIDLSQITISENFAREEMISYNETNTSITQNSDLALMAETIRTSSNIIEENTSVVTVKETPIIVDTYLQETKTTLANDFTEEKFFTPTIKPQQMQSLLHLVQKK